MNGNQQNDLVPDRRSLFTWAASALLFYALASGAIIAWMPFGPHAQYTILVHTIVGVASLLPLVGIVCLHWRRWHGHASGAAALISLAAITVLGLCLLSGLAITAQAAGSDSVHDLLQPLHAVSSIALGALLLAHLAPVFLRYRGKTATPHRARHYQILWIAAIVTAVPFGVTQWLSSSQSPATHFQAFVDDYDWRYGDDRPFWPSRAAIEMSPWRAALDESLAMHLGAERFEQFRALVAELPHSDGGYITRARKALQALAPDASARDAVDRSLASAAAALKESGAISTAAMTGDEGCGYSDCHEQIYAEWQPSAHGFAAIDFLYRDVQELLAESRSVAETRSCAGCHDPVALLGGERNGESIAGDDLVIHEGISCVVCHSISETDTLGNGGYTMRVPQRYLFADEVGAGGFWNRFLIRGYPEQHVRTFQRPLYKESEYCAACHKQVLTPGSNTPIGFAQDQNEYDSWREGHWYDEDDPDKTIKCRECHMPLVDSEDPASGDDVDAYRTSDDKKHRSHRMLGSNMYIPVVQEIEGGEEQSEATISWLRGDIEIPEIAGKWTTGAVVDMTIVAPDQIAPGELVDLRIILHNNKTGHDFPAGPLDLLESWVEITVTDNLGRRLMHLGDPDGDHPTIDAPIVYKADWYDEQGMPVERHNLWDVVGASYTRQIESGGADIVEVPFRCPAIARPRLSGSASEEGSGERRSDVVFSIDNEAVTQLTVEARLLYRKANPEFLRMIYGLERTIDAPIIELNSARHTIRVAAD